jgi:hypothetical protein
MSTTNYVWELGIDWNAIETEGKSYMRQGFVNQGAIVSPILKKDDTITFRIFDVTGDSLQQVAGIGSFVIFPKAADNDQAINDPFDNVQPTIVSTVNSGSPGNLSSTAFGVSLASWTYSPVTVVTDTPGRFLLSFQAQARGPAVGTSRVFGHDPEMIVGPNGG